MRHNYPAIDKLSLVLVDPDTTFRGGVRSGLQHLGFVEIRDYSRLDRLFDPSVTETPDLVMCDIDAGDGGTLETIRAIRNHQLGDNPFLPVVCMTGNPSEENVTRAINSGADDLVIKPVSPAQIEKRLVRLIERRRLFVVTSEYIGPDRRHETDRVSPLPLIEVPNMLKIKAAGHASADSIQRVLDSTIRLVSVEKLKRDAYQLSYLAENVIPNLTAESSDRIRIFRKMRGLGEDVARRLSDVETRDAEKLCRNLVNVVRTICDTVDGPPHHSLALLKPLSQAIHRSLAPGVGETEITNEISNSIESGRRTVGY